MRFRLLVEPCESQRRDYKTRRVSLAVITVKANDSESMLQQMYQIAWKCGLLDFNVLLPHATKSIWLLVTYFPFRNDCFALETQHLAAFNYSNCAAHMNITFDRLYAVKNRNFNRCPIVVATYHVQPYVLIRNEISSGRVRPVFDGIEVAVMDTIAQAINATVIYVDVGARGDVYDNGTVMGSVEWVSIPIHSFHFHFPFISIFTLSFQLAAEPGR